VFVSYEYGWPFVKCTFRKYSMLLKILPSELQKSPLSKGYVEQVTPILRILCYNGSLIT
jgi:hypothetical protein